MKAVAAIKQLLRLPVATKCRGGFLIALVAVVTVGGKAAITHIGVLKRNEAVVCLALGLVGFLSWLSGRLGEGKRVQLSQGQAALVEQAAAGDPLAFFRSLKCWGVILVLSAAILSGLATFHRAPVLTVQARPLIAITNETPKVSFPPLDLQGIIVNGAKSSALINGQVLFIGEGLGKVVLVAVDPEYVTVELEGQTKSLVLEE
jgi:hypothetical protein